MSLSEPSFEELAKQFKHGGHWSINRFKDFLLNSFTNEYDRQDYFSHCLHTLCEGNDMLKSKLLSRFIKQVSDIKEYSCEGVLMYVDDRINILGDSAVARRDNVSILLETLIELKDSKVFEATNEEIFNFVNQHFNTGYSRSYLKKLM